MIEEPKRTVAELESLNEALLKTNKELLRRISELQAPQAPEVASTVAQEVAKDVSNSDARALFDFFMLVTHYDFVGDNPAHLRQALNAQSTASKLLTAHIERQRRPTGGSGTGGVGNMRARIDEETGDLVGYFATPQAKERAMERSLIIGEMHDILDSLPDTSGADALAQQANQQEDKDV